MHDMDFYRLTVEHTAIGRGANLDDIYTSQNSPIEAAWTTLFGPLNQIHLLQRLAQDSTLSLLETPLARAHVESRSVEILRSCIRPPQLSQMAEGSVYELRRYNLASGTEPLFLELLAGILDHRERFSPCVGVWSSVTGRCEQIWHMWAYHNLEERDYVRSNLIADPIWNTYSAAVIPMIIKQTNLLLKPMMPPLYT